METTEARMSIKWVENRVKSLDKDRGHPRILKAFGSKMFAYAILSLCAAQLFVIPHVSSYEYQQCPTWWVKKGCRVDYHRSMTSLIDDRGADSLVKIDWDNFDGYVYDLACRCRAAALKAGNSWFALENYGVCFSGKGPLASYLNDYPLDPNDNCVGVIKHNKTIVSQADGEICVGGYFRAFFYEISNIGAAAPAAAPEEEEEEEAVVKCTTVSDVILVVDVSGSVGVDNFKLVLEFLQKFLNAFDFSNGKSRLGIVTFDEKCYVDLTWMDSGSMSLPQIRERINTLKYTAGSTLTDNALKCARDKIIKLSQRAGVPKTMIVMTDGQSWNGLNRLPAPSSELRGMGCKILAIGIGNDVDPNELQIITGSSSQIFLMSSFRNLIDYAAKHLNQLLSKACIS